MSGMWDSYLICQALGWEWNTWTMILTSILPFLIVVLIIATPFILGGILDGYDHLKKKLKRNKK